MPINRLGVSVPTVRALFDISAFRWILNADASPVAGVSYTWLDDSAWADANNLKG